MDCRLLSCVSSRSATSFASTKHAAEFTRASLIILPAESTLWTSGQYTVRLYWQRQQHTVYTQARSFKAAHVGLTMAGTFIDGKELEPRSQAELKPGKTVLGLGSCPWEFRLQAGSAPAIPDFEAGQREHSLIAHRSMVDNAYNMQEAYGIKILLDPDGKFLQEEQHPSIVKNLT